MELVLSKSKVQEEILNLIAKDGQDYRKVTEPVKIVTLTEETEIPASSLNQYYSDGTAPNRIVPAGTIMTSSNTVITPEQFTEEYEEYHDEEGNLVPDMFTQVISVRALANPFDEPIKRINGNGFVLEEFEEDCYFVESNTPNRIEILSGDYFKNEYFLQANAGQAKKSFSKNANNDIH